jgi:hypothetical protein
MNPDKPIRSILNSIKMASWMSTSIVNKISLYSSNIQSYLLESDRGNGYPNFIISTEDPAEAITKTSTKSKKFNMILMFPEKYG